MEAAIGISSWKTCRTTSRYEGPPVFSANPVPAATDLTVTFTVKNTGDTPATTSDDPFQQGFYVGYRFTNHYLVGNGRGDRAMATIQVV
jgi:hypothetical protein